MTIFDLYQNHLQRWAHHAGRTTGQRMRRVWQRFRAGLGHSRSTENAWREPGGGLDVARFVAVMVLTCCLIAVLLLLVLGVVAVIYEPVARQALHAMGFPT